MRDEQIDSAIDDVARAMTAGEPDAYLRTRVLSRIDSGFGIRGSGFAHWRPGIALLGAAAMIVAAVVMFRGGNQIDQIAQQPETVAPTVRLKADTTGELRAAAIRERRADTTRESTVRLKPDATADRRPYVPPSASEIEPIVARALDVESIAVGALPALDSIQLERLQPIAPIAIAPLDSENQGDPR